MFVILPVYHCHLPISLTLFLSPSFPLSLLFHRSNVYRYLTPFFNLLPLNLLSGSELGAMEGPPGVPGLHRDEDPTSGSHVQQEEAIIDGQREEQSHKPPKEVTVHLPLKAQQSSPVPLTLHHARLGCFCTFVHTYIRTCLYVS